MTAASTPTKTRRKVKETRYIGIDVGKRRCQACIIDDEGSVREEFNFNNTSDGIRNLLDRASSTECRAVLESTGNLWIRLYETLENHGVEVKLANPNKTRAIASARIKTDKLSARILAHLLRADLIAECHVPPRDVRAVRALLRQRESLVKIQTMAKNQTHALLDKHGFKSEWSDLFGVHGMESLKVAMTYSFTREPEQAGGIRNQHPLSVLQTPPSLMQQVIPTRTRHILRMNFGCRD